MNEVFGEMTLVTVGLVFIFLGFMVVFLAALLVLRKGAPFRGRTRGGALIMIGPIPIVFGTDKETVKILLILSMILVVIVLVVMLLPQVNL